MKLMEDEAKKIFAEYGIKIAEHIVLDDWTQDSLEKIREKVGEKVVVKALVDVGGRGKAGGVWISPDDASPTAIQEACQRLLGSELKGVPVERVLIEGRLSVLHECYVSITIDRQKKSPIILFADDGGVDIEELAQNHPSSIRKNNVFPLCETIPDYISRHIVNQKGLQEVAEHVDIDAPIIAEIKQIVNTLYRVFQEKDCILVEVNPLVITPDGVYAADAKIILDDNALYRQDITQNRDLSRLEQEAEEYGFSFVELDGDIGVIGNGAGLTMATLDLVHQSGGKPANFLDIGGGADKERVKRALQVIEKLPNLKIIVVNLLGGITRCDEVAEGVIAANVSHPIMFRLAGTNEEEGRAILNKHGYSAIYQSTEDVIKHAVDSVQGSRSDRPGDSA